VLRDVVHSKNFDDGAVVHRHPLFDSTRETNTTPRRNSSEKKTKRRRTSSSSSSSPPSLPFSSLVSLFVVAVVLSSFFRLEKISIPKPKRRRSKNVGVFCGHKKLYSFFLRGQRERVERDLSLSSPLFFFFFFFLSLLFLSPSSIKCLSLSLFQVVFLFVLSLLFHPLMRVRSRQKIKKKREYSYI